MYVSATDVARLRPVSRQVARGEFARRDVLKGGLAGAAALAVGMPPGRAFAADPSLAPFLHGVASGDPLSDRVVLWTRLTTARPSAPVLWRIATDPQLRELVGAGRAVAEQDNDWTVKVDATGLLAGRTYYYGFTDEASGLDSLTGRTRTAPLGQVPRLRVALVSCSNYSAGYFNPYARLGDRSDLDLVVHVGDYFYESASRSSLPDRVHEPRTAGGGVRELVTLADYRARYAQYRLDPDLRAAHQQHPWAVVWDDHESCNDAWQDGSPQHDPDTEGEWEVRKQQAVRAYAEWLPIRLPDPADPVRIWRSLPYGDLVDLIMIDTRLYGRNAPGVDTAIADNASDDPSRSMLGPVQYDFLTGALRESADRGTHWRLIGNQTMISPHNNNPADGPAIPYLPDGSDTVVDLRQGGGNEGSDNWGAYRVERDQLIDFLRSERIRDTVVLTGDIHTAWGCDVTKDPARPYDPVTDSGYERATGRGSAAVEIVCTSVTSNNLQETLMGADEVTAVNAAILAANNNVQHTDQAGHGYCLLDITPDRVLVEWWETGTARARSSAQSVEATYLTTAGSQHLVPALAASTPPSEQPEPAPGAPPEGGPAPVVPDLPAPALGPLAVAAAVAGFAALRRRGNRPDPTPPYPTS